MLVENLENVLSESEYNNFMSENILIKKVETKIEIQNKYIKNILTVLVFFGIILFLLNFLKVF